MTCPYTCPVAAQQEQTQIQPQHTHQSLNNKNHNIPTSSMIYKKRMTVVTDLSNLNQYGKRRLMGNNNNDNADLDILGGKSAWENVDRTYHILFQMFTTSIGLLCTNPTAETMTIFYKRSTCSFQWNE
jgi:hypothetical protein